MRVSQFAGAPNTAPPILSPKHIAYLTERAVDPDTALYGEGVRTVTPEEGAQLLGFTRSLVSSGMLIPYANLSGYVRVRLDEDGTCRLPEGREVPIYIPSGCQREGDTPLFVVEGPIKALALVDHGFNAIALGGVTTTLTSDHKLNSSWADVALVRRNVFVVFDANRQTNVEVARAEARLVMALEHAGATVRVVALPLLDGGGDQGPDDFIAAHDYNTAPLETLVAAASPADPVERAKGVLDREGALGLLEDLPFLLAVHERGVIAFERVVGVLGKHKVTPTVLRKALKSALERGRRAKENADSVTGYGVRDGQLCLVTSDGSSEQAEPICNFTAHVVEDRTLDDGSGETARVFVLEGALADGQDLERISVSPEELIGDLWPTKRWGSSVSVTASIPRSAHHLMNAIKAVSDSVKTTAFSHTGFREHNGNQVFLHAGGAIGDESVVVDLTGSAAKVVLPDTVVDPVAAVRTSLDTLRIARASIALPLHAAVYRAPLNEVLPSDFVVGVCGKTGNLKSSVTAVFQGHYGDFDHTSLPISWEWTANAIETGLHRMKDVLTVIDDLVPKADPRDEIHRKVERTIRSIANGAARGRMTSDLRSRPERPCRATVVITGEEIPRGESIQARLAVLPVGPGDVDKGELTRAQLEQARLPHAMRAYIEWLQPQMSRLKTEVKKRFIDFRAQLQVAGHLRAPAAIAQLLVGAFYFGEFAKAIGVMSEEDAVGHVSSTRSALVANARAQAIATEQSNPALRFVEVFRSLYVQHKVSLQLLGQQLRSCREGGGADVGWKDDSYAYILTDTALALVNKELAALNEAQSLRPYGLWKRMAEEGYIEPAGKEPTHRLESAGRVRVAKMPLSVLRGEDPGGHDPGGGRGTGLDDHAEGYDDWECPPPDDDGARADPLPLGRPMRFQWPVNDGASRIPGSLPDVSKDPGGSTGVKEVVESTAQTGDAQTIKTPSSRIPGCSEGRVAYGSDNLGGGRPSNGVSIVGDLSPRNIRESGNPGAHPLAATLLAARQAGVSAAGSLLAIALPGGPVHVMDLAVEPLGQLGGALAAVTLVGHDLRTVVRLLSGKNVRPTKLFDTMLAWRLYDGGQHNDENYFAFPNAWRTHYEADPPSYPDARAQVEEEARAALEFEPVLRTKLAEDELEDVAALEFALLPIVAEMEATGVAVDAAAWKRVTSTWKTEAATLRRKLTTGLGVKNVDDDKQVLAALRRLGFTLERTSGEVLAEYSDHTVVAQLVQYRRLNGFVRSSGKAVLEALARSPDGRVRTNLHQLGARTGRMSCSEPNLMGLPRDQRVRGCIIAPPGKKLIIGDYKAIEMRVIADQTGDEQLRQVFATPGRCPHRHTATVLLPGRSEETVTEEEKNQAKPVNFGLCFGMSSKTLVPYARKNFKVVMTELQAEEFKKKFLEHYEGVRKWQERTGSEMASSLRTRSGRVSYYPYSDEGYNARLSFPVQGTAADGMKAAIVLVHPKLTRLGARIVLVVHDELIVEAAEEHAQEVLRLMRECMVAGMTTYGPTAPIEVDLRVASTWAKASGKAAS